MAEMIGSAIITSPLDFVCEHAIHVGNDFHRHIYKAFAENESNVRRRIGTENSLKGFAEGGVGFRF